MKEKYEKISNIEVVEEIKYLGVIVQAKRNVFEGQKNEIMKKIKRLSVMTNSVIEKSLVLKYGRCRINLYDILA